MSGRLTPEETVAAVGLTLEDVERAIKNVRTMSRNLRRACNGRSTDEETNR